MKSWIYFLILLIFIRNSCCHSVSAWHNDLVTHTLKFSKEWNTSNSANIIEKKNIQENLKHAEYLNKGSTKNSARYGFTKFSHLSFQEFKDLYLSDLQPIVKPLNHSSITSIDKIKSLQIPQKLDWRSHLNYSIISPVKNQNKCGGCWAFSTVETVESMYSKAAGDPPIELSVQEVIDCTSGTSGCAGGDTCTALDWMVYFKPAIVTEKEYPLTDTSDYCKMTPNTSAGVHVKDYKCYRYIGEDEMLQLLQNGPIVAAVDATTWNNYQGGIIQYHCEALPNHAVQVIGYDLTGEVPYYIVRNSWGTDFGHEGYLYIKIGDNLCGITSEVSTVSVYV